MEEWRDIKGYENIRGHTRYKNAGGFNWMIKEDL